MSHGSPDVCSSDLQALRADRRCRGRRAGPPARTVPDRAALGTQGRLRSPMMNSPASEIAERLADNAEAVCRRYLSKGRREERYWLVGDVCNTPGRSLYVRLVASPDGLGAAGK